MANRGAERQGRAQLPVASKRLQECAYRQHRVTPFDAPFLNGRAVLHGLFDARTPAALRFSEVFEVLLQALVESACRLGLEGVRTDFGSLLLAVHDDEGQLRYAGNVGSGFDQQSLVDLKAKLDALDMPDSPFAARTGLDRTAHWVRPVLLVEVSFSEWTDSGRVRHAVFHRLRSDKPPQAITREKVVHAESIEPTQSTEPAKPRLRVTHPERVIDASTGATKLDLVRFYGLVAPLLLKHLKARPTSMVRAPDGVGGELFFQKHMEAKMPGVRLLDQALDPDHSPLMEVPTAQAVLSAAQMNVIEFHTWNALKSSIGKPDRMTFDLDPGEGVDWKTVRQATELVHGLLSELGLVSCLKTSGGKGLHVVVPLKKQYDWDTVKSFSQAIVQHLARIAPQLFVAKSGPKNRVGKIFVDYLRNGFGATTVAAWSARARPGLGVSVPLGWDELGTLSGSAQWTIANIHDRLDRGNAPWADYQPQGLAKAMKALDFKPA